MYPPPLFEWLQAVTALLKRSDDSDAANKPVGVIPVGHANTLVSQFFPPQTHRTLLVPRAVHVCVCVYGVVVD